MRGSLALLDRQRQLAARATSRPREAAARLAARRGRPPPSLEHNHLAGRLRCREISHRIERRVAVQRPRAPAKRWHANFPAGGAPRRGEPGVAQASRRSHLLV